MSSEFSSPFINELPNPSVEVIEALQGYVLGTLNQASANFSLGFSGALKVSNIECKLIGWSPYFFISRHRFLLCVHYSGLGVLIQS